LPTHPPTSLRDLDLTCPTLCASLQAPKKKKEKKEKKKKSKKNDSDSD